MIENSPNLLYFLEGVLGDWKSGVGSLKVKEYLIVIPTVQTLHTSANIMHICIQKNILTVFQQKLHL